MAKKQTPGFTPQTKLSSTDISGDTHNVKIQEEYIKNQQERNKLHEREAAQIERINKRLQQGYKATATQLKNLEDIRGKWDELNDTAASVQATIKKTSATISDIRNNAEKSIDAWSSLSSIYKTQKGELNQINLKQLGLKSITEEIGIKEGLTKKKREQALNIIGGMSDGMYSISTATAELAELTSDDADKRRLASSRIRESIQLLKDQKEQLAAAGKLNDSSIAQLDDIIAGKEHELKIAEEISSESKLQKSINEELHEALHEIQKTIHKTKDGVKMLFSGWRGGLSLALMGAGELAHHFAEINKELGVGMTEMGGLKTQAALLSMVLGEQAGEAVIDLAKDLGDSHHLTTGMAIDAALLATNYGLSAKQAAFMSVAFGELSHQSYATGKNTSQYVRDLAMANGVAPAQVMKDIADNTEFFALYSRDGGKNIGEAAVAAAKLGVGLDTAAKVADHLLDYQNSVQDEMEASVLLGKDLNLNKARELAYQGDIAGAMKEAVDAAGGIEAYSEMDYYQRQSIAKAIGVSNTEMQQMVAHQETLNGMHGVGNQLYSQGSEILTAMGNSLTGKMFMGMGGLVIGMGQLNTGLAAMGTSVGSITKKLWGMVTALFKASTYTKAMSAMKSFGGRVGGITKSLMAGKSPTAMYQSLRDKGVGAADALKQSGATAKSVMAKSEGVKSIAEKAKGAKETAGDVKDTISKNVEKTDSVAEKVKSGDNGEGFKTKAQNIAAGLKEFASAKVVLGALALIPVGIGLAGMLPGLPTLWLLGKMNLESVGVGLMNLAIGVGFMGGGEVFMGALGLIATAVGLTAMLIGIPAMIAIASLGELTSIGLIALATGLTTLGGAASTGLPFIAVGLIAAFGVALIPLTYALSLLAPLVTAVGGVIVNVFGAMANAFVTISGALPTMVQNFLPLIGMILPIFGLAAAIMALSVSLIALSAAGVMALPALAVLGFAAGAGTALMGGGGGAKDDEMITLLRSIDSKIGSTPAIKIDGKTLTQEQNVNSSRQGTGKK